MTDQLMCIQKLLDDYLQHNFMNITEKMMHNHPPLVYVRNKNSCPYCKIYGNIFEMESHQHRPFLTIDDV